MYGGLYGDGVRQDIGLSICHYAIIVIYFRDDGRRNNIMLPISLTRAVCAKSVFKFRFAWR